MSEPSSPDSLLERQLPDWKTAVLNVVNKIDLENGSILFGDQHAKSLIALEPRQCRVIALKILDANSVIARRVLNAMGPQSD